MEGEGAEESTSATGIGDWENYLSSAVSDSSRPGYERVIREFTEYMSSKNNNEKDLNE